MNIQNNHISLLFVLVLLFFLFSSPVFSAILQGDECGPDKDFVRNFRLDLKEVITSPGHWKKDDLWILAGVLGTGAALFILDDDIQEWVRNNKSSLSEFWSPWIRPLGQGGFLSGMIAALYITGELTKNTHLKQTALMSLQSWLTSGVLVLGIKFLTGRARPQTGKAKNIFKPFVLSSSFLSFPSGDAASAFAVAAVIAEQPGNIILDIIVYSLASLVAVYRVHDDKHWASDIFIGSVIGYLTGKKIVALNRQRKSNRLNIKINVSHHSFLASVSYAF